MWKSRQGPLYFATLLTLALAACDSEKPRPMDRAGYHVREGRVWFMSTWTSAPFEVPGADAATFVWPLRGGDLADYAKDRQRVFLRGQPVKDADPASFEILTDGFSRDAAHVFRGDTVICDDPAHFEILSANFVKNSKAVYRLHPTVEVQTTDVANFRSLVEGGEYSYFVDGSHVYVNGNIVTGAAPATFRVLKGAHGTDARRAYYFDKLMPDGTLLASFEVLEGQYSRDAQRVYFMEHVVAGADPATFQVTDAKFQRGQDAKQTYEQGVPLVPRENSATNAPKP